MLGALLLSLLAADAPKVEPYRFAVFTTPLAPLGDFGLGALNGLPPAVMVPLGFSFSLGDLDWSFDAAYVHMQSNVSPFLNTSGSFEGGWFNLGVVIRSGDTPLNGFFIAPKLTVGVFWLTAHRMMTDCVLGIDMGYQLTRGHFYVAFILGLGIGVGYGENDALAGPWIQVNGTISEGPDVVLGINLHLLRLGYAF